MSLLNTIMSYSQTRPERQTKHSTDQSDRPSTVKTIATKPESKPATAQSTPNRTLIRTMLYKLYISRLCLYRILILVHNVYISTPRNICMKITCKPKQIIRIKRIVSIKRSFEI